MTGVGVLPTHRRQGVLSRMATAEHEAARARGEVVAMLYASEYAIYGRFGYGPGTTTATWTLEARATGFHEITGSAGTIEIVAPDSEGEALAQSVFDHARLRQPGEIWRRPITWLADFGRGGTAWGPAWKGFVAIHRDDAGAADGFARYHVEEKWEQRLPRNLLIVDDLHAVTDTAYAALWRFLGTMDWVASVKAERRSPAERLPWLLTNARAAIPSDVGEGMWVKLLDIRQALETRTYEREGSLALEIVERDGPGRERRTRLLLEAAPDGARAAATNRSPDLTVDASAVSAAYLGGTRLRDAVRAQGWDEHRPGALAKADALFATLDPPWCSTFF